MAREGILFVVSAPSGSGKTTLCEKLIKGLAGKKKLVPSISATTRKARQGEHHGRDYFFISRAEFLRKRKAGQFIEWARVLGKFYGTPREFVERHICRGDDVLLNIDVQGALKIKRMVRRKTQGRRACAGIRRRAPRAVFIFILPPTFQELEQRLRRRSTENSAEITRRLCLAKKEMHDTFIREYDYIIVNDTIRKSVDKLKEIIRYERGRK